MKPSKRTFDNFEERIFPEELSVINSTRNLQEKNRFATQDAAMKDAQC